MFKGFLSKMECKTQFYFAIFLGNWNRTRQTGEWSMICARPTLLTLAWASGRVLMSHPVHDCMYWVHHLVNGNTEANQHWHLNFDLVKSYLWLIYSEGFKKFRMFHRQLNYLVTSQTNNFRTFTKFCIGDNEIMCNFTWHTCKMVLVAYTKESIPTSNLFLSLP